MKFHTTRKELNSGFSTIISIGFAGLDNLLVFHDPVAYLTRTEGWAADVYDINGVAICTGNAPFGNVSPSYQLVRSYDQKAREIHAGNHIDRQELLESLLAEFIEKAKEGVK